MTKSLTECISDQVAMPREVLDDIEAVFVRQTLEKGEHWLRAGQLAREMAFVQSGYLRMYDLADGKEVTLWLGSNPSFITSLSSFVFESANYWNIQALTPVELRVVSREAHLDLSRRHPQWLEFDNVLLARSFALLEQSMFSQLHTTAQQRFDRLMADHPDLFNHVPLQHIASMLGVAPETLSRLRRQAKGS